MTKSEALEKYAMVPLYFNSYYKYTFTFIGVALNGDRIIADIGGSSGDIYKLSVDRDTPIFIDDVDCFEIKDVSGKELIPYQNG